ncbi:MAG TPA: MBL fold metallo-hydrolase [Solirubrobacteraceae bacterium]|jgi:L-ascorbate metabolism protein UlaG (beta-lactamase superfamily)
MAAGGERLTWVGHATVVVELGGARAITDPVLRRRVAHLVRHGSAPAPGVASGLDGVLLSHLHLDHADARSLRRIDRDVTVLAPSGAGGILQRLGFRHIREVAPGARVELGGMSVTAVPATHDGRRHPLADAAGAIGFVAAGARRVYFAGDTDLFAGMEDLADDLDVALLPVWGWGPTLGPGHMDPRTAAEAAALLRPRMAVPVHWGTLYPAGLARWRSAALTEPGRAFARHAAELAPGVEVRVLTPGETLEL